MSDTDTITPSDDLSEYGAQAPMIPSEENDDEVVVDSPDSDTDTKSDSSHKTIVSRAPEVSQEHLAMINDIIGKIDDANNILVALSSDPSVDELATAIGLSLSLDRLGKRVTAIYSGETPDALNFLKPENTFETQPDALQDFVIAINKDKADHLRYKIDGDFVKIFITPYRSRISEDDLEFTYGDFNVDLVIALDVANGVDLDSALREHGRIMHDATIVNITTSKPGKLGEIEWSDTKASSVSELVTELLFSIGQIEKPEATALLTGIVAATDRFANASTTSHSMEIASFLIGSGADQQLIAKNIASATDGDNENTMRHQVRKLTHDSVAAPTLPPEDADPTSLDIRHDHVEESDESERFEEPEESDNSDEPDMPSDNESEKYSDKDSSDQTGPIDDSENEDEELTENLEETQATLSTAGAEVVPEQEKKSFSLEVNTARPEPPRIIKKSEFNGPVVAPPSSESAEESSSDAPESPSDGTEEKEDEGDGIVGPFGSDDENDGGEEKTEPTPASDFLSNKPEKIVAPSADFNAPTNQNPAASFAPQVASAPEANNIPDMNYMPLPGDEILPPPPTPPVDFNSPMNGPVSPMNGSSSMASSGSSMNPMSPSMPIMPPASPMPAQANSMPRPANPFLNNPMGGQTPGMAGMPNMPTAQPMQNANPFIAQSSMPGQNPSQPMNNPGSFQIPGM